jgi:lycopene cyclase domain-containing protein
VTYPLLVVPFALVTVIVTVVSLRRPGARQRLVASLWTALVLVAFTAVFDNLMIAADLFTYPEEHISGIRIGLAPIEDFSYPICAAFLLPSIGALLPSRTDAA